MSNTSADARRSAKPMRACWNSERIARAVTDMANLVQSESHYFLASHAPFHRIHNDRTGEAFTETALFEAIFHSSHRNVQTIVHGEPGCGKSHLIHWLKLRCDEEVSTGKSLGDLRRVLIERRNGSLKDALQQIIDQLGEEFAPYLSSIRGALRQISSDTARQELAGQLRLELGPRRKDRDLPRLQADLKYLPDCFVAPAFGQWLCRQNGTIAAVVARLTESSTVEQRQAVPEFQLADFQPPPQYYINNPPVVCELINQFADSEELCLEACRLSNEALREAVRGMTGLSGADLQKIFFDIRRDLGRRRSRLALFVEDVSVMSALDKEVVVALEPQAREGLCDLFVVLGMTDSGFETIRSMPANQLQRATHIFSVAQSETKWGEDEAELANFTARYLNTIRLSEDRVRQLAELRRTGGDVTISACENCPLDVADECHSRFGYVELSPDTKIGMFPFTVKATGIWMQLFDARGPANFGKTPRAVLMQLLEPALRHSERVPAQFPPASITFPATALPYWTSFEEQYCGGWPSEERRRLQRLATAWIRATDAHTAAAELETIRAALAFPAFSRAADRPEKPVQPTTTQPTSERPKAIPVELSRVLVSVDQWLAGNQLAEDTDPRQLLFDLVRTSIGWPDVADIPARERQHLLRDKSLIEIDGQRSRASGAVLNFARNDETAELIRSLARFRFLGKNSWSFVDSERSKRVVATWLRRNRDEVVRRLLPRGVNSDEPLASAVGFLSVTFVMSQQKRLPADDPPRLVEALFQDLALEWPKRCSSEGDALVLELRKQHKAVREMLAHELNIPQGNSSTCNFIDPRPLLRLARSATEALDIRRLPDEFHRDFWGRRYLPLKAVPSTERLWDQERAGLRDLRDAIASTLQGETDPDAAIDRYCAEVVEIRELQKRTQFPLPHPEFDSLWAKKVFTQRPEVWKNELRRAAGVLRDTSSVAIATYSPEALNEIKEALRIAEDYLDELIGQVRRNLEVVTEEGDPDELLGRLTRAMGEIGELGKEKR